MVFKIFYLFIFRKSGGEEEREGKTHQCERETSIGCLSTSPDQAPSLQSRHVP